MNIPTQLKYCRFNRVKFKGKRPFESGWQNKPYSYKEIQEFFPRENYGVMCGRELRVLDDDTPNKILIDLFVKNFGKTFKVRDHLYFKFDNGHAKKIIFFDQEKNHLGELQGEGSYVVGAGSMHPSGEIYELKENLSIIEISYNEFLEVFKDYIPSNDLTMGKGGIEQDDEEIIKEILPKWKEGDRQNLTLDLAGYLRKNKGFGFKHTQKIIQEICGRTGDKDLNERLNAVKETYFKDEAEIKGISGLKERDVEITEKRKDHLLKLLSVEKKPYKCMAIGEHKSHYYFGTILEKGNQKIPAIVLDNGNIYLRIKEFYEDEKGKLKSREINEIKDIFGLKYRFDLFDDVVDNLWSNKSIKEFCEGKAKKQDFKEIFEIIKNKNKKLMYHVDERIHSFIACDIISNYFYPLFNAKGRTYFQADFGSGKSRQSLIYQKLSFNSLFASNISPASFERVIESTGGTIIVDNFDNCNDDLKKAILQVLEVYYKKGGKNIKADGQGNKPIAFNGYSPLVINNIIGLPQVTESRCNKIQLLKTEKKDVVDVKINEKDIFWEKTKDDLHVLALQKWEKVKEAYENLDVKELTARELEKSEAVLTIAKVVGEDVFNEILAYTIENNEQQSMKDPHDEWAFIIFEFLNQVVLAGEKNIKVKEITESVKNKIINNPNNEKQEKLKFSHYVGKVLGNIPTFKKKTIDGYVHYSIKREDLTKIIQIRKYDRYLKIPNNHTIPHLTSLNTTNTTNHTTKQAERVMLSDVSSVKNTTKSEIFNNTFAKTGIKEKNKDLNCCGSEFEKDGEILICGQLWKGDERKYCPNCRNDNSEINFEEAGI
jgi:hypothetical protein